MEHAASAITKSQFGAAVSLDITECIQLDAVGAHNGHARECKGAGIPL